MSGYLTSGIGDVQSRARPLTSSSSSAECDRQTLSDHSPGRSVAGEEVYRQASGIESLATELGRQHIQLDDLRGITPFRPESTPCSRSQRYRPSQLLEAVSDDSGKASAAYLAPSDMAITPLADEELPTAERLGSGEFPIERRKPPYLTARKHERVRDPSIIPYSHDQYEFMPLQEAGTLEVDEEYVGNKYDDNDRSTKVQNSMSLRDAGVPGRIQKKSQLHYRLATDVALRCPNIVRSRPRMRKRKRVGDRTTKPATSSSGPASGTILKT